MSRMGRLRVLVVDSEGTERATIADALRGEGYEVLTAGDGEEALGRVATRSPDLILLELVLPRLNAWQFAAAYHALPGRHAPLIAMSSVGGAVDRAAREIGAVDALAKPLDLARLGETIALHIGRSP